MHSIVLNCAWLILTNTPGTIEFGGLLLVERPTRLGQSVSLSFVGPGGEVQKSAVAGISGVYGIGPTQFVGIFDSGDGFTVRRWSLNDATESRPVSISREDGAPDFGLTMAGVNRSLVIDPTEKHAYFIGFNVRTTAGTPNPTTTSVPAFGCVDLATGKVFNVPKPKPGGEFDVDWKSIGPRTGIREWNGRFWPFDAAKRRFGNPVEFVSPLDKWDFFLESVGLLKVQENDYVILSTPELKPSEPAVIVRQRPGRRELIGGGPEGVVTLFAEADGEDALNLRLQKAADETVISAVAIPLKFKGTEFSMSDGHEYVVAGNATAKKAVLWIPRTGEISWFDLKEFNRPVIHARFFHSVPR